jgi:hypothetical protein
LWYNEAENELIQGFGGEVSGWTSATKASYGLTLWGLRLNASSGNRDGSWRELHWAKHDALAALTRPVSGITAFTGDSAYVLGGTSSGQEKMKAATDRMPLPGLVHYNMTTNEFRNLSASQYYGTGAAQRGQMVHLPMYGDTRHGLFLVIGGYSSPVPLIDPGHGHVSFANITLYNPATRRWHWQTAQGDVPRPRGDFCAAGASSTNGTYEL